MAKTKPLYVEVNQHLRDRIERFVKQSDRHATMADMVRAALIEYMERHGN